MQRLAVENETMTQPTPRVDPLGRAFKGSQLQIQIYVNRRRADLDDAIRVALPDLIDSVEIDWRTPIAADGYREYHDSAFLRRVGLDRHEAALSEFWPRGGPHWDALARLRSDGIDGVLLVEAKSYPEEMRSTCKASPPSRERIDAALASTAAWLGVERTPAWTDDYYQFANRLAHLWFLREVTQVPAWLVNVNFVDDRLHNPTDRDSWDRSLADAKGKLGLPRSIPGFADVFLPGRERSELTS